MHPRLASHALVTVTLAAALSACGFAEDKADAVGVADRYFAAMAGQDASAALALYAPRFFEVTPRDEWLKTLSDVRARCGASQSHSLTNWNVSNRIGTDSGSTVTLVYDVEYAQCGMEETISTFRPEGGQRAIIGHHFKLKRSAPEKPANVGTVT